jgi:hypothetical protein
MATAAGGEKELRESVKYACWEFIPGDGEKAWEERAHFDNNPDHHLTRALHGCIYLDADS